MSERKNKNERIFLYVPHAWIEKAIEIGWQEPSDPAPPARTSAVLMEWKKDIEPIMPFRCREKRHERR